jgi:REP element-mobilizing transposase RayT
MMRPSRFISRRPAKSPFGTASWESWVKAPCSKPACGACQWQPIVAGMPNYRRAFVPGGCWFFTVNLLDRRHRLLTENIVALREATRITQARHPFAIDAMVVLPDHIHAVWTLPPGDADFSLRWRLIKISFAHSIPNTERRSAVRVCGAANAASGSVGSGSI